MHPLHDYIARQISDRLKDHRIVVMGDPRKKLPAFFEEACEGPGETAVMRTGKFGSRKAAVCSFQGSFLEVRSATEPVTDGEDVDDLVVYVPGVTRDEKTSLPLEIEKAGHCYLVPALKQIARNVLRKRFTDVAIDEMLGSDKLTYADLARMTKDTGNDAASLLKSIFGDTDTRATIATWIADDVRDGDIDQKGAGGELRRTLQARIGLETPEGTPLAKMRAMAARYVLGNEFRLELKGPAPASLSTLAAPASRDQEAAVQHIAARMRESTLAAAYERLADQAQSELGLSKASVPGDALGVVDTFRFEEHVVVARCLDLIAKDKPKEAAALLDTRGRSFWVDRQPPRKAVWEACRLMTDMGRQADDMIATIAKANGKPEQWVERYVAAGPEGWHRFDHAQRRLETLLAAIEDENVSDVAVARCRAKYDEVARRQAEGFVKMYESAGWTIAGILPQHRVWAEAVANLPKPLAVVAVDAMRYEIGVELADRLGRSSLGSSADGLFAQPRRVRPVAIVGSRQVAVAKMTTSGPIESGEVVIEPNKGVNVGLILTDDMIHYGFVVDYLAEALRDLRKHNYTEIADRRFSMGSYLVTRDRKAVKKKVSGLMKTIYPNGQVTKEEIAELLEFAMEGRRRVKEQLKKMGSFEYYQTSFSYSDVESGEERFVGAPDSADAT